MRLSRFVIRRNAVATLLSLGDHFRNARLLPPEIGQDAEDGNEEEEEEEAETALSRFRFHGNDLFGFLAVDEDIQMDKSKAEEDWISIWKEIRVHSQEIV